MNLINCIVVDDEPIARDILTNHIEVTAGIQLVKSCINASEAYEGLHQHKVDLIFLDIQMPVITGVDFLRSLRNPPLVVFTTAYHNYAVEGFELNSVDYLLKPVTYDRFYQAIQKVKERVAYRNTQPQTAPALPADYIFIKQDTKLVRVNHNQISYIQAEKDYSSVYLNDDKRLFASMHLKLFENALPKTQFLRIHRSYIIHLSKIKSIKGNMVEFEKIEIPIGANYKEGLFAALGI
ncbi:LytTR family DNA-binding domain-containing protein [Ferruginibacter sp. HRS2-29]|uniref:LytR/AlgR family response regulator transcription factor n=1 Tax=Ferruginibacter sp. HRS2-29 TaxID=2487334 RepID=UPI0020CF5E7F|nr:response regulator transcription factor [Ferruginibacter sp. HRS2-29]MCP9751966.1 response regulator [Ferruginibacter sp. HRS2-29]